MTARYEPAERRTARARRCISRRRSRRRRPAGVFGLPDIGLSVRRRAAALHFGRGMELRNRGTADRLDRAVPRRSAPAAVGGGPARAARRRGRRRGTGAARPRAEAQRRRERGRTGLGAAVHREEIAAATGRGKRFKNCRGGGMLRQGRRPASVELQGKRMRRRR